MQLSPSMMDRPLDASLAPEAPANPANPAKSHAVKDGPISFSKILSGLIRAGDKEPGTEKPPEAAAVMEKNPPEAVSQEKTPVKAEGRAASSEAAQAAASRKQPARHKDSSKNPPAGDREDALAGARLQGPQTPRPGGFRELPRGDDAPGPVLAKAGEPSSATADALKKPPAQTLSGKKEDAASSIENNAAVAAPGFLTQTQTQTETETEKAVPDLDAAAGTRPLKGRSDFLSNALFTDAAQTGAGVLMEKVEKVEKVEKGAAADTAAKDKALGRMEKEKRRERGVKVEVFDRRTEAADGREGLAAGAEKITAATGASGERELTLDLGGGDGFSDSPGAGDGASSAAESFEDKLAAALNRELSGEIVRNASIILRDSGEGTIRLSLRPETLGTVKIRLEMAENKITGHIVLESAEALKAFEREAASLERAFQDSGYQGARFELSLASQGGQGGHGGGRQEERPGEGGADNFAAPWVLAEYEAEAERAYFREEGTLNLLV